EIQHFYSNYHSLRYVRDDLVIRLHRRPTEYQLALIEREFSDIKTRGEFRLSGPLSVETDEPSLDGLTRLIFVFNRRDHGRLRMLIDFLNDLPAMGEGGNGQA
ncbi:MAG: cytochrome ubiquinol oxidase subunit, partial [Phycisphaerales bacterium]|nr:cytochrome ubiquinol oxidase subunit [Phycisphaerales bacterium]